MQLSKRLSVYLLSLLIVLSGVFFLGNLEAFSQNSQIAVYAYDSAPMIFWDPSDTYSNENVVLNNVYETLLRYEPFKGEFKGALAKDWKKSEDGLTWTFSLRKGVKFHTGGELTADAVKFSIERTMERGKGSSFIWDPVEEIKVVDDYTVKFHLKYPAPLDIIASAGYSAAIFDPDHSDHEWFRKGNDSGTGPYTITSHEGQESVVLSKFDDYWGGWEGKHYDQIIVKKVAEPSTRRMMLGTGKADFVNRLPVTSIEALEGNPEVDIVTTPSFQNLLALFNTAKDGPIGNPLVRKALAYSLSYKRVVKDILGGYGRQSRGVVPYGLWGHSKDVQQYSFSLETAEELLSAAGYDDGGFELLLTYVSGNEYERRVAELWQSKLAKLNIDLEIRGMPWSAQIELGQAPNPNKRQDIFLFYWWPDYAHPHSFLSGMFESREEIHFNFTYYNNPLFDRLINKAKRLAGVDRDKATEVYAAAQKEMLDDAAGIGIFDLEYVRAKRASMKGYSDNPAYPHVVFWYDCYPEE